MTRAIPDLWECQSKFTAESYGFWMTWIAPLSLKGRLPDEHYKHMVLFSQIIKESTRLEITEEQIDKLDEKIRRWHAEYER